MLDDVRPNRSFNIFAAMFKINDAGNLVPLLPGDVTAISYTVYQKLDILPDEITQGDQITGSGSFVPASVIYNTMLTGTAWARAALPSVAPGYNANFQIPGSFIPTPGAYYEIQISFTLANSNGLQVDDWYGVNTLDVP